MTEQDRVEVEILLKPAGGEMPAHVGAISTQRPDPGNVERCRRWFAAKGLDAYATDFSVVCSGPKTLIEEVFGVKLTATDGRPGTPPFWAEPGIAPPADLAELIESVALPGRPDFFP